MERTQSRIPRAQIPVLSALLELSAEDFESFRVAVSEMDPNPTSGDELFRNLDVDMVVTAGQVFTTLLSADEFRRNRGWDAAQVADELARAQDSPVSDDASSTRLAGRLQELLELPTISRLGATIDAASVERGYIEAKVYTDVRPVFEPDDQKAPFSTIILHQLKINYMGKTGEYQNFFVTLDESDLQNLVDELVDAQSGAASLRSYLSSRDVPLGRYPTR